MSIDSLEKIMKSNNISLQNIKNKSKNRLFEIYFSNIYSKFVSEITNKRTINKNI